MKIRKKVIIKGKVQGVGYRAFVHRNAHNLGVNGWVRNLDNGDVEAIFEGEQASVNKMMEACNQGPLLARVLSIDINNAEEGFGKEEEKFDQFIIR
ncbi:MAG: acylphosphatase [Balneolales bacterium]